MRKQGIPNISYPRELPVAEHKDTIIAAIREHPVLIIAGETGSGKTTQLPKMCLDAGFGITGKIGCTQPRRVAALSVSKRIAYELATEWGEGVGCQIRFSDKTSDQTWIKLMTDGILLNEIQRDPLLSEYEAIIVDEAHERSLNIDFIIGYLRLLHQRRPDLKIIITSATIDTQSFSAAFGNAPIIEVSGRMFPVEVVYRPLDVQQEEAGDFTYLDAAGAIVEEIVNHHSNGDILIFLPGERDIHEMREMLAGARYPKCEIIPLFGRLANHEQQKIFNRSPLRKIIVATNIAETSITVPGIRYVIDTGLARISRYSPHTRTQRLPIEEISQSSANQRKGRCGRVADGVCYRIYDEANFLARDAFSTPEILRSNLAAVILRMVAFRLGDIATFPFLDPPDPRAIRAGYQLLFDLGALDASRRLTPLGKQLAQFPVDPTVGRMLLQAHQERVLKHVLIIAAGLSIQDPRERPLDQQEAADRMHQRFVDKKSDFITLLNLWNAYHNESAALSQSKLRKFCKQHFVAYTRMREWRDIHQQLLSVVNTLQLGEHAEADEGDYDAIHRSILTGLLGNIAIKDNGNHYRATHSRKVMLFPGSGVFDQKATKVAQQQQAKKRAGEKVDVRDKSSTPAWIVCGEWMETSRLFARMVAQIDVRWVVEFGAHLLKVNYTEPAWVPKAGRVLVRERSFLYGLEVANRRVGYGRIQPEDATEIFIREALIPGDIQEHFTFLTKNIALRERIESLQTRMRTPSSYSLDERIYRFYAHRVQRISSTAELRKYVNAYGGEAGNWLVMQESDLVGGDSSHCDTSAFPDMIQIDDAEIPLEYTYRPGEEVDGVTVKLDLHQFDALQAGVLDWMVPGYVEERVDHLLRALPKKIRKQLFPIADKTQEIMAALTPTHEPLTKVLSRLIAEKYKVCIAPEAWQEDAVPLHLKPRIEIVSKEQDTLVAGRDWECVRSQFQQHVRQCSEQGAGMQSTHMWKVAQDKWEAPSVTTWSFGDLPERVTIGEISGVTVYGYPGLEVLDGTVAVRLFADQEDAQRLTRGGYRRLCEHALGREMAWLQKDLKALRKLGPDVATLCPVAELQAQAYVNICNYLFCRDIQWPLTRSGFEKIVHQASLDLKGLVPKMIDWVGAIIEQRQAILVAKQTYPGMGKDLGRLVPADFMFRTPFEQLVHLPRYLKAMQIRARRLQEVPQKDVARVAKVQPMEKRLNAILQDADKVARQRREVIQLFWMLEEFRVATFAQELGTACKVSEKRLNQLFACIE